MRNNTKGISIVIIGACLVIFAAYLFLNRTGTDIIESNISLEEKAVDKMDNSSENCPVSSTGIPLCELSPEQREREELKDRLNGELSRMQNGTEDTDPYAPIKKPAGVISPTSSVRLKVAIPGSDHAMLVAEDLKNVDGITDVYWSPPNLYDIKYDATRTTVGGILSREIFKKYNASVMSSK